MPEAEIIGSAEIAGMKIDVMPDKVLLTQGNMTVETDLDSLMKLVSKGDSLLRIFQGKIKGTRAEVLFSPIKDASKPKAVIKVTGDDKPVPQSPPPDTTLVINSKNYRGTLSKKQLTKNREDAKTTTIERAKDVWALDYAEQSDGTLPVGNQIARYPLRPQHLHVSNWWKEFVYPYNVNYEVDKDAFVIVHGFFSKQFPINFLPGYSAMKPEFIIPIRSIQPVVCGVTLPVIPIDDFRVTSTGLIYPVEVPYTVSPKADFAVAFEADETQEQLSRFLHLGVYGEVIGIYSWNRDNHYNVAADAPKNIL